MFTYVPVFLRGNLRLHPCAWMVNYFLSFSPNLCVGFLFLVVYLRLRAPAPARRTHTHTQRTHTHTQLVHAQLVHTQLTHTQLVHITCHHTTYSHTTYSHTTCSQLLAWQAWHLGTSTCTLRGRRGTWWHGRAFCVAGVALTASGGALGSQWTPRSPRLFVWQVWHLATSAFTLRGKCGTWRHGPRLGVAGVALGDIDLHFAWQAWHLATST